VPLIVAAVGALATTSYRYAQELARAGEQNILAANQAIADIEIARIEQTLFEADETVINAIDQGSLRDPNRLKELVRLTASVESVIVLDESFHVVPDGQYSNRGAKEFEAFRRRFEAQMLPALDLRTMAVDEHRYLHREFDGRYYLLSVTRRVSAGKSLYVVIENDLALLVGEVFPITFEGVDAGRVYQVVDEAGTLVFGFPFTGVDARYVIEARFPTTLRAWTLRLGPRDLPALLARQSARRPFDVLLIGLSAATVFVGLVLLTVAVRAERRANQLKSDFIANVSHELKTPLSLIHMFAELVATGRSKSAESTREYAQIITRESDRLARLIDNVLDFARFERGKAKPTFTVGDLGEVLLRSLDVYRYRLEREGMRLELDIAADLPPVRLDENAMTLLILNLVDNAVKYAAEGRVLAVSVRPNTSRGRKRVVLSIRDFGPGIPADEHPRIFERFYRGRGVRGRPVRGSGIGLSLVKNIAEVHGGEVNVESTAGQGSTFTVSLPALPEGPEAPAPPGESAAAAGESAAAAGESAAAAGEGAAPDAAASPPQASGQRREDAAS
jgi:two-component system phosphate regulon sensor histidine kinase PhoR